MLLLTGRSDPVSYLRCLPQWFQVVPQTYCGGCGKASILLLPAGLSLCFLLLRPTDRSRGMLLFTCCLWAIWSLLLASVTAIGAASMWYMNQVPERWTSAAVSLVGGYSCVAALSVAWRYCRNGPLVPEMHLALSMLWRHLRLKFVLIGIAEAVMGTYKLMFLAANGDVYTNVLEFGHLYDVILGLVLIGLSALLSPSNRLKLQLTPLPTPMDVCSAVCCSFWLPRTVAVSGTPPREEPRPWTRSIFAPPRSSPDLTIHSTPRAPSLRSWSRSHPRGGEATDLLTLDELARWASSSNFAKMYYEHLCHLPHASPDQLCSALNSSQGGSVRCSSSDSPSGADAALTAEPPAVAAPAIAAPTLASSTTTVVGSDAASGAGLRVPYCEFELLERLGEGASGMVYSARLRGTGEKFAIKLFGYSRRRRVSRAPDLETLISEVELAMAHRHAHICSTLGTTVVTIATGTEPALWHRPGSHPAVVMELVEGGNLDQLVHGPRQPQASGDNQTGATHTGATHKDSTHKDSTHTPPPLELRARFAYELAASLTHLHSHGVHIHKEITPRTCLSCLFVPRTRLAPAVSLLPSRSCRLIRCTPHARPNPRA